jgi:Protein of unknown function (DUF760)
MEPFSLRACSLRFALHFSGYMLSNAEYRLSLSQSLGVPPDGSAERSRLLLQGDDEEGDDDRLDPLSGKVKGKIRIRYWNRISNSTGLENEAHPTDAERERDTGMEVATASKEENIYSEVPNESTGSGLELEVDAAAYLSELRTEVSQLRDELNTARKEKEDALRKDLLLYIRTLPKKELLGLTSTMSPQVLIAMKGLVKAVLAGIGEGQIGPDTVTEQSAEAMAQLCLWQLAIGYNLRTLEVREEMKNSLKKSLHHDEPGGALQGDGSDTGSSAGGAFE